MIEVRKWSTSKGTSPSPADEMNISSCMREMARSVSLNEYAMFHPSGPLSRHVCWVWITFVGKDVGKSGGDECSSGVRTIH